MKFLISNQNGHLTATQVDDSFESQGKVIVAEVSEEEGKQFIKSTTDYLSFQLKLSSYFKVEQNDVK